MKLVTYSHQGAQGVGVIASDPQKVVPAAALGFSAQDMNQFIRQLDGRSPTEFTARADAAPGLPLSDCRLLAPIPHPQQDVVCLGVNYYEHRDETLASNIKYDGQLNKTIYFSKRVNRAVDPDGVIDSHADLTSQLDYEVELAVILGRDAKNVPLDQVKDYVLGYTILNDVSARDLQSAHQQWYFGKSLDGFTPMGPCIVTADEIAFPPALDISSAVNGEPRQHSNTRLFLTGIPALLEELTAGMTLLPGTIIATGTPAGVGIGFDPPKFIQSGDVVECTIQGIGTIRNTVR